MYRWNASFIAAVLISLYSCNEFLCGELDGASKAKIDKVNTEYGRIVLVKNIPCSTAIPIYIY